MRSSPRSPAGSAATRAGPHGATRWPAEQSSDAHAPAPSAAMPSVVSIAEPGIEPTRRTLEHARHVQDEDGVTWPEVPRAPSACAGGVLCFNKSGV